MMDAYYDLLARVLHQGERRDDRTGVGTLSLFGTSMRFDLQHRFPLLAGRKLHWKSIVGELIWMLQGRTNIGWLNDRGITIWDEWADEHGDLGPIYGAQWRDWNGDGIDQIADLVAGLRADPYSRRHLLTAWNPSELHDMALPPCHVLAQFYVSRERGLSCQLYQRSADMFLGVPFNIASYALLTHILAALTRTWPEALVWVGGDTHLYLNHQTQAETLLSRPRPESGPSTPTTILLDKRIHDKSFWFDQMDIDWVTLHGYKPLPPINAKVAV